MAMDFLGPILVNLTLLAVNICAQTPGEPISWRAGDRLARPVDKSKPDVLRIPLAANVFVRLEIIQDGADLTATFRNPDREAMLTADSVNGRYGPETIVSIAESQGDYSLEVKLTDGSSVGYELRVIDMRPAAASDLETIRAFRSYYEACAAPKSADGRREALLKLETALASFQRLHERYMEALGTFTVGSTLRDGSDFRQALSRFQQAAALFRTSPYPASEATAMNSAGGALDVLGEPQDALRHYRKALDIYRAQNNRTEEARLRNNIGWTEATLANWNSALEEYRQALVLLRQAADRRLEAQVLNNMGVAYANLGQSDEAVRLFGQALELWRADGNKRGEAYTLDALARVHLRRNEPAIAKAHLDRALETWKKINYKRGLCDTLILIGAAEFAASHHSDARTSLTQALEVARSLQDRRSTGQALLYLGRVSLSEHQPAAALDWSRQALIEFRQVGDDNNKSLTLETMARAESQRNNLSAAREYAEASLQAIESSRAGASGEQLRASFLATQQNSYAFYTALLLRMGETALAFEVNERSRARSLLDMLAVSGAGLREGVDPSLLEKERATGQLLNAKGARLLTLAGAGGAQANDLKQEIRTLELEYDEIRAKIRTSSPRYSAITQPTPVTVKKVQTELLDEDTVLLQYALDEDRSYVWAVEPGALHVWELPARAVIEKLAQDAYELVINRSSGAAPTALKALSDAVIRPALSVLRNKRLLIVADGPLQRIPFSALPSPGSSQPMLVAHEIVMLPSASALAAIRRDASGRTPAPKLLALLADPVFDLSDPRVPQAETMRARRSEETTRRLEHSLEGTPAVAEKPLHIPRLPYTAQEAEQILASAPGKSFLKLDGFKANKTMALSGVLSDYRYLHFATHGYLNTEHPGLSAMVLAQMGDQGYAEDGFLRVSDIYNMKLSADLVVLSACQTGLGKDVRGEGTMGLTRAFLYAGAPRVVVSLWSVNDLATAKLMAGFYRRMLRERLRPSEALRQAQLEMRKQKRWSSPYYWAAFVQQGEWR